MLSNLEIQQTALREISTRRQIAKTKAEEQKTLLKTSFPELDKAEKNLQNCGIALTLASISAEGKEIELARKNLADAQKNLSDVLAKLGRPSDIFEPRFTCTKCNDTGTVKGNTCTCVIQLMRKLRRKEIEESSSLSITSFDKLSMDYYPMRTDAVSNTNVRTYMAQLIGDLKEYAEDFDSESANLFLFGNSGLGKTHVALAIAGEALTKGYDVIYLSSPDFFSKVENFHFNNQPQAEVALIDTVTNADLLILDDLGTELISSFTISTFYTLLNARMASRKPTIFTSNITDGAVLERRYTEKIASRLSGACEPFRFIGDDIRAIKARE